MIEKLKEPKIQKISGSYYIAIPKVWADVNGIQEGQKLPIFVDEFCRLIIPPPLKKIRGDG